MQLFLMSIKNQLLHSNECMSMRIVPFLHYHLKKITDILVKLLFQGRVRFDLSGALFVSSRY